MEDGVVDIILSIYPEKQLSTNRTCTKMTSAPASASPTAMPIPMPLVAPVTRAVLPVRSNRCDMSSLRVFGVLFFWFVL